MIWKEEPVRGGKRGLRAKRTLQAMGLLGGQLIMLQPLPSRPCCAGATCGCAAGSWLLAAARCSRHAAEPPRGRGGHALWVRVFFQLTSLPPNRRRNWQQAGDCPYGTKCQVNLNRVPRGGDWWQRRLCNCSSTLLTPHCAIHSWRRSALGHITLKPAPGASVATGWRCFALRSPVSLFRCPLGLFSHIYCACALRSSRTARTNFDPRSHRQSTRPRWVVYRAGETSKRGARSHHNVTSCRRFSVRLAQSAQWSACFAGDSTLL